MKLLKSDKERLLEAGWKEEDFPQLQEAALAKNLKITHKVGDVSESISQKEAVLLLGDSLEFWNAVGRAAWHKTARKQTEIGTTLYFDCSKLGIWG